MHETPLLLPYPPVFSARSCSPNWPAWSPCCPWLAPPAVVAAAAAASPVRSPMPVPLSARLRALARVRSIRWPSIPTSFTISIPDLHQEPGLLRCAEQGHVGHARRRPAHGDGCWWTGRSL